MQDKPTSRTIEKSNTQDTTPDERALEVEQQLTDEERFSLIVSVMGTLAGLIPVRDERIPEGTAMSAGSRSSDIQSSTAFTVTGQTRAISGEERAFFSVTMVDS